MCIRDSNEELGSAVLAGTIITLISTALVPYFSKMIGKRNTMLLGMIGTAISQLILHFADKMNGNVPMILFGMLVYYISYGLVGALIAVMLSDAVDFGEWKNGVRAEGLVTSFSSFSAKLGMGLGSMLLSTVLTAGGYIAISNVSTASQNLSALNAIRMGFIWIPMFGYIASGIVLLFNNVDKIETKMTNDLSVKHRLEQSE